MPLTVHLKRGVLHRCLHGHPWIYDGEIAREEGEAAPGDVVEVREAANRSVGFGFHNPASRIRVRLLCSERIDDVEAHLRARLAEAIKLRESLVPDPRHCRLVFGESDFLPGLVVDRYGDALSIQVLSLGIERHRAAILAALQELTGCDAIFERSTGSPRVLEGLDPLEGFATEKTCGPVQVLEDGLRFEVDLASSQKTGYFFDQRANRRLLAPIVGGARVLDCFTYAGAFALHAARHGATHVTAIDYSDDAIAAASRNAMINGLMGKVECKVANCFDLLRTWSDEKRQFDVIVLDPPAFAKSRAATEKALAGYKEINLRALKMIAPGGWLLTCSCSYHASREDFLKAVAHAAHDAHRRVRLVREGGQDADHPVHPAAPETNYLKCFLLKVE